MTKNRRASSRPPTTLRVIRRRGALQARAVEENSVPERCKELRGDHAELLVFVDQVSRRADDKEASVSAAQLQIEAEKVDGAWTITQLRPI